jgi:hypothetical protein
MISSLFLGDNILLACIVFIGVARGLCSAEEDHVPPAITGARLLEISRFYTPKPWIGKGVGAHLMQACIL